jgi:tRNA (guanine37-N1)-methyltransferase
MRFAVVTLFPEMLDAVVDYGITGRARRSGLIELRCWNPRDFTGDRHQTVDDRPYGGGPGMVLQARPVLAALRAAKRSLGPAARAVYLSPQGAPLVQETVRRLSAGSPLVLLAGRYEGVDERIVEAEIDEELSLGDFVLSGGEIAAMAVIDAVTRLLPGALGDADSAQQDSFVDGLLDCPHYTRPEEFEGRRVPEVLLSGDHERIRRWRLQQALGRTWERRPELLAGRQLDDLQQQLLDEYIDSLGGRSASRDKPRTEQ